MSLFGKGKKSKSKEATQKNRLENIPPEVDEQTRQKIAENNPWMKSKKRHIDVYQELAFSVAQWRLAAFAMMALLVLAVFSNFSLARSVKIQPYVIQVDEHGYAIPVKEIEASNVDARIVSAQIGGFIINSRARLSDIAAQLVYSEKSFKSVAGESNAARLLNAYYRESPPTNAKYPVSVKILSVKPLNNNSYQASWTETVLAGEGADQEFGYLGTFSVVISPPADYATLLDNPLGVYITDYNIIRSY
jgi:type IV secretory pathway TrbF-like protein